MQLKYKLTTQADTANLPAPLHVKDEEVALIALPVPHLAPGDTVQLEAEIHWEKVWSQGELTIIFRRDNIEQPSLYETTEQCVLPKVSKIVFTDTQPTAPAHVYILSVRSSTQMAHHARLNGKINFDALILGSVTEDQTEDEAASVEEDNAINQAGQTDSPDSTS